MLYAATRTDTCQGCNQVHLLHFPPTDRVCHQQGLSLWVPFQNSATAVTNLYKGIRPHPLFFFLLFSLHPCDLSIRRLLLAPAADMVVIDGVGQQVVNRPGHYHLLSALH